MDSNLRSDTTPELQSGSFDLLDTFPLVLREGFEPSPTHSQ